MMEIIGQYAGDRDMRTQHQIHGASQPVKEESKHATCISSGQHTDSVCVFCLIFFGFFVFCFLFLSRVLMMLVSCLCALPVLHC